METVYFGDEKLIWTVIVYLSGIKKKLSQFNDRREEAAASQIALQF